MQWGESRLACLVSAFVVFAVLIDGILYDSGTVTGYHSFCVVHDLLFCFILTVRFKDYFLLNFRKCFGYWITI